MTEKVFLGIDVSKGYADFLLLDEQKNVLEKQFALDDNKQGRDRLKEVIAGWLSEGNKQLFCGLESTGGYESNWYRLLKKLSATLPLQVARLNARAVKAVGDATLTRTITDGVSARNIALYLISFADKIDYGTASYPQNDRFRQGRQHNNFIRMQQKQKVQLNNQLEKLLYQYFPEILIYCRHGIPGWLLRMLGKYSCASAVLKAGSQRLSAIKGIGPDKAQALIKKVTASAEQQQVDRQIQYLITCNATEILHKEQVIKEHRQYLADMYAQDEQVQLLTTIGGIGQQSAVELMLEIETILRFASSKKIASYFGVHPCYKQSGDGIWANRMSKKGRPEIRAILYMAALTGIRHNPVLKQVYARSRAKAMKHYQAMGVVMHKLLRLIYGVLKNKQAFDESIDRQNQSRAQEKQNQSQQANKESKKSTVQARHRYQPLTTQTAPISRRTEQKRRKQIASQTSITEENTGLLSAP